MKLKKYDHITEARKALHWLPIEARIKFKIIMLTWKALNKMAPSYIKHMLKIKEGGSQIIVLWYPPLLRINLPISHTVTAIAYH